MQVMVFFSSCNSVKYHAELLNYIDIPVKDIHGKQKQQRRTTTFMDFCKVLLPGAHCGVSSSLIRPHQRNPPASGGIIARAGVT